jgi:Cu+-exporting ATPase
MTHPANTTGAAPAPLRLEIRGMTCGHCVGAVERALAAVPGAHVHDVAIGRARLTLDAGTPADAAIAAVRDAGYDARVADAPAPAAAAPSCCASGRA